MFADKSMKEMNTTDAVATDLLERFFAIGGNYKLDQVRLVKEEIRSYVNNPDYFETMPHQQLQDVLRFISLTEETATTFNNYFFVCDTVLPVFNRLESQQDWDYYDLRILAAVMGYHRDYKKSVSLLNILLSRLADFIEHPAYTRIKTVAFSNITNSLLNTKYLIEDVWANDPEIEGLLLQYADHAISLFQTLNMPDQMKMLEIRKALARSEMAKAHALANDLQKAAGQAFYNLAAGEITKHERFARHPRDLDKLKGDQKTEEDTPDTVFDKSSKFYEQELFDLSQDAFKAKYLDFIATRITQLRIAKNKSGRQLSAAVGRDASYMTKVENKQTGMTFSSWLTLLKYLGVTPKEFFNEEEDHPIKIQMTIQKLKQLDDDEFDTFLQLLDYFIRHKSK